MSAILIISFLGLCTLEYFAAQVKNFFLGLIIPVLFMLIAISERDAAYLWFVIPTVFVYIIVKIITGYKHKKTNELDKMHIKDMEE